MINPASRWNIKAPFDAPDEAFMALELVEGELKDKGGTVEYPEEFTDAASGKRNLEC